MSLSVVDLSSADPNPLRDVAPNWHVTRFDDFRGLVQSNISYGKKSR